MHTRIAISTPSTPGCGPFLVIPLQTLSAHPLHMHSPHELSHVELKSAHPLHLHGACRGVGGASTLPALADAAEGGLQGEGALHPCAQPHCKGRRNT
eukprot:scaffold22126_cov43-Tisochrysis_lutea.AAC.2